MRIIKKKILDDLSKKIDKTEEHAKKIEVISLDKEENEKLQRFELYQCIRMEKYVRQGSDPTFGNLDPIENTSEEFEYHLSLMLNDNSPEERYRQRKEVYYFHPSYIEMEKRVIGRIELGYSIVMDNNVFQIVHITKKMEELKMNKLLQSLLAVLTY